MKDPTRLINTETGDALSLLRAASQVPAAAPPHVLGQTLGALGVGTVAPVAMGAASSFTVIKALAVGVAIGAGASGVAVKLSEPKPVASASAAARSAASDTRRAAVPEVPSLRPQPAEPAHEEAAEPAPTPMVERAAPTVRAPQAAPAPSLATEIAQLDRARQALATGQPHQALAILDEHGRQSTTQLGPEASLLRVRALAAAGKRDAAQDLARRLLESATDARYAARLREAAGLESP
jgi:hypothetical protein